MPKLKSAKWLNRFLILSQVFLLLFIGPPLTYFQVALANPSPTPTPDLAISEFADAPDPFSPNNDSVKDTATLNLTYNVRAKAGLKADEVDKGLTQRGSFYLDSNWKIYTPDKSAEVMTLQDHHQIFPLVAPNQEEPVYFSVDTLLNWNGLDQFNQIPPDGVYFYQVTGEVNRFKQTGKAGEKTKEKTLFTSAAVEGAIMLDTTAPVLKIVSPADGLLTNQPELKLIIDYTDNLAGVDLSSFKASLAGQDITGRFFLGENRAMATSPAPEGKDLILKTEISDLAGNPAGAQISFTVDLTPPVIEIADPADNSIINTNTPLIKINYVDQLTGLDTASFHVLINGSDETAQFTIGSEAATYQIPETTPLPDGPNTITALIKDRATNQGQTTSVFQVQGMMPPVVTEKSGFIDGLVYDATTNLPLTGVEIILKNGITGTLTSDAQGRFSFPTPDKGEYLLEATKDGYHYAQRKVFVESTRDSAVDPIYLLPVDAVNTVSAQAGGTVTNSAGTLRIDFPPGTFAQDTEVKLTLITHPRELPNPLPDNAAFVSFFFGEPSGPLAQPVRVRMKNTLGLPAGTPLPIGYWDRENGRWVSGGMGWVSADGQWLEGDWTRFSSGGFSLSVFLQNIFRAGPGNQAGGSPGPGCRISGDSAGSFVGYRFGHLKVNTVLPSLRRLGLSDTLEFIYESSTAAPNEFIAWDTSNPPFPASTPVNNRFAVSIEGVRTESYFTPQSQTMRGAYLFDGRNGRGQPLVSGGYQAQINWDANYSGAVYATTNTFSGPPLQILGIAYPYPVPQKRLISTEVLINNQINSPFGAGWSLAGLERLHPNPDGSVMLTEGDGARSTYKPTGRITTVAGTGLRGYAGDGGPATQARFNWPVDAVTDPAGNLYIYDYPRIRKVDMQTGLISAFAG
mgnify:FL=1